MTRVLSVLAATWLVGCVEPLAGEPPAQGLPSSVTPDGGARRTAAIEVTGSLTTGTRLSFTVPALPLSAEVAWLHSLDETGTCTEVSVVHNVYVVQCARPGTLSVRAIAVSGGEYRLFVATYDIEAPGTAAERGASLYAQFCASCHHPLATSTRHGASAQQISEAISGNAGGVMGSLTALTFDELSVIALALSDGPVDAGPAAVDAGMGVAPDAGQLSVRYAGCFVDAPARTLPVELLSGDQSMTVEKCVQAARTRNLKYAGVQYSAFCFGGDSLPPMVAPESECNMACSANGSQVCGGGWRNSVYAVVP